MGLDIVAGGSWRGYDVAWRSINELSAIGSPVRGATAPLFALVNILTIAFGLGIWQAAGGGALRIVAGGRHRQRRSGAGRGPLPQPGRPAPRFLSAGVLLAAGPVFCIVAGIGAGAFAVGGWLRWCSIAILAAYSLLTVVGYASQRQPRTGFQERLVAYTWMVWLGLLAGVLLSNLARQPDLTN